MQKKRNPESRILKLRNYEDKLAYMRRAVKEERGMEAVADWEHKSDAALQRAAAHSQHSRLLQQRQADIEARRQRLAAKLYAEERSLQAELLSSRETPQERREKIAAKARKLQKAREEERDALAATLRQQHFAENCDPARDVMSTKIARRTARERDEQVEEQRLAREEARREEQEILEMIKVEDLKRDARYLDDQRRAREQRVELQRVLDRQVREAGMKRTEEARQAAADMEEVMRRWEEQDRRQEAEMREEKQRHKELMDAVGKFNANKLAIDVEREKAERELDLLFLREAEARDQAEEGRQRELEDRRREEMRRYREHLRLLAIKEQEDTSQRDRIIEQYQKMQQERQDARWEAQQAARDKLMAEVAEIRGKQVALKAQQREQAAISQAVERQRTEKAAQEAQLLEQEFRDLRVREALQQRLDLEAQMAHKQAKREVEKRDTARVLEEMGTQEQQYTQQIDAVVAQEPLKYYGRKKVQWFY